jgi:hypothetical protein
MAKDKGMAKFYSKSQNYKILVKPYIVDVKNGIPVHNRGEKIEFINGEYQTDDPAVINFLRKHAGYGLDFVEDKTPVKEVV